MSPNITYETLFDYLREERNNVQLQKLPDAFFEDVVDYLVAKESSLNALKDSGSLTYDNSAMQYRNAKRIIEDIYERREKKIISIALNKSRTKSQLIDTSALLSEEKIFFNKLCDILDYYRDELIGAVFSKKLPNLRGIDDALAKKATRKPVELEKPAEKSEVVEDESIAEEKPDIAVKFTQYVDKFVGPDLEILGPFNEGDIVKLPANVVEVILSKGYAEKV